MTKKRTIIAVVAVIAVLAAGAAAYRLANRPEEEARTVPVERTTIVQDVEFSGRVQAQQSARLGFESTGVARTVNVKVGDVVTAGMSLVTLDTQSGVVEVAQARADRLSQSTAAALAWDSAKTTATTTRAENARTLEKNRQSVRDAYSELKQAEEVWQQTVRESGDESSTTKTKYGLVLAARSAYRAAQQVLAEQEKTVSKSNTEEAAATAAAYASYQATQQAALNEPGLSALAATEELARLRLSKTSLLAPFTGVITEKNIAAGEVAVAGQAVITMQTVDETEVVAAVPETDATKINPGMTAVVELEAYGDGRAWNAVVKSIDPAATILEGVPTYQTYLAFVVSDEALRPGLTAAVTVHAAKKENVLAIPRRAVASRNGESRVRVKTASGMFEERVVKLGLSGSDGRVEIVEGLTEGDAVVIRPPDAS